MKTCSKCQLIKPLSDFYYRKDTNSHRNECKDCNKATKAIRESVPGVKELRAIKEKQRRITYKEHINSTLRRQRTSPEAKARIKLQTIAFKQNNPGKITAYSQAARVRRKYSINATNSCTKLEFINWYTAADKICTYCGKTNVKLTVDHVTPLIKGGTHTTDNFTLACNSCNSSKGGNTLIIWMAKLTNRSKG